MPAAAQPFYQEIATQSSLTFFQRMSPVFTTVERKLLGLSDAMELCLAPMWLNSEQVGLLVLGSEEEQENLVHLEAKRYLIAYLVQHATQTLYRASHNGRLQVDQLETMLALSKALEARKLYPEGYGQQITNLSEQIALNVGYPSEAMETVHWAALLHDIGKLGIPDQVLKNPGPLTSEEWAVVRKHPQIGAEIVINISNLLDVAELVQDHHERWDGTGYPNGMSGEEIPLGARIIAVADAYTAMVNHRVYRSACTPDEATAELERCSGTIFDPGVVRAFLRLRR
jgi:putative nucleotidyltransferase with HDIG domain